MINILTSFIMFFWFTLFFGIDFVFFIIELLSCSAGVIINRIFMLHFALGYALLVLIFIHIFLLHSFSSSIPLFNTSSSLILPFISLFNNDCLITFILFTLFFCFYFFNPDLFGNCDNLIFSNAVYTPLYILPE